MKKNTFFTSLLIVVCVFSVSISAMPRFDFGSDKQPIFIVSEQPSAAVVSDINVFQHPSPCNPFVIQEFRALKEFSVLTPQFLDNVRFRLIDNIPISPPEYLLTTFRENKLAETGPDIIRKTWRVANRN